MRKENREVIIEVDIFLPNGKTVNDWEFIKTLRLEVNSSDIDTDSEKVSKEIAEAIKEWKAL